MKFGANLQTIQTPEWRSQYLEYEVCQFVLKLKVKVLKGFTFFRVSKNLKIDNLGKNHQISNRNH